MTESSTAENTNPTKPTAVLKRSLFYKKASITPTLIVLLIALGWVYFPSPFAYNKKAYWITTDSADRESLYRLEDNAGPDMDRLESSIMSHATLEFVQDQCKDETFSPQPLYEFRYVHVTEAMKTESIQTELFFLLNGKNEGLYVSYNGNFNCILRSAQFAAVALGADTDLMENGVRLYSQQGLPVRNAQDLRDTKHIVHILLDFQIWVWPGIRKGHVYTLDDGVVLTTVSLSPKVFDVQHFFNREESNTIIAQGFSNLVRSKVVARTNESSVSDARTSHTAFLSSNAFVRNFQRRGARVARLPSPSFAEVLQLVRYNAGEFYRKHLDTFETFEMLPKNWNQYKFEDYSLWVANISDRIRNLDPNRVPEAFREGGRYFPTDTSEFRTELLTLFREDFNASNQFLARTDDAWDEWLRVNIESKAQDVLQVLLESKNKPHYLPYIIRAWEKQVALPELRYDFPKGTVNGLSHLFRWIQWLKERISFYAKDLATNLRPDGDLYPSFGNTFHNQLVKYVLQDYRKEVIVSLTSEAWYDWLIQNKDTSRVGFELLRAYPQMVDLFVRSWEFRAQEPRLRYTFPRYVKHTNPQRFVTLFLYLNEETVVGGETVFPFSVDRLDENVVREGMNECSTGLAVPPRGLHASLFYVQTPEGEVDLMSRHGGCPPENGTKWGSNLFMWNADAVQGAQLWRM